MRNFSIFKERMWNDVLINSPIVYINLDRNTTRNNRMIEMFRKFQIPQGSYQRFSAVDGKKEEASLKELVSELGLYSIRNKTRSSHMQLGTIGAVGCYASHARVWDMVVKNGWEGCFILEDDAKFNERFTPENLEAIKSRAKALNIDCIRLFSSDFLGFGENVKFLSSINDYPSSSSSVSSEDELNVYDIVDPETVNAGYYVTRKGCEKLLKKAYPMEVHVDFYIWLMRDSENISLESVYPYILEPFSETSDIAHNTCPTCTINDYITFGSREGRLTRTILKFILIGGILTGVGWYLLKNGKKRRV